MRAFETSRQTFQIRLIPLPHHIGGLSGNENGLFFSWQPEPGTPVVTVSYNDGVFMVAGQKKGTLLVELLARLHKHYERVVLVDDVRKNIDDMSAALKEAGVAYHGLWYKRMDKSAPTPREEAGAVAAWDAWKLLLSTNFPGRLERMTEGCAY